MKKSVYGNGTRYNATTIKYTGKAAQILTRVSVSTPSYYENQKTVETLALWDTGANISGISPCIAKKLGIQPTDYMSTFGISGEEEDTAVFDVNLNLNQYVTNIPLRVTEVKLHKEDGGNPDSNIGFLIGMDIIGQGDFFTGLYKDKDGKPCTMMTFRLPSAFEPVDYLEEVQAYNRELEAQRVRQEAIKFRRQQGKRKKK